MKNQCARCKKPCGKFLCERCANQHCRKNIVIPKALVAGKQIKTS